MGLFHSFKMPAKGEKKQARVTDVVTRDYTIHLHKRLHDRSFKSKAPRAIREIRKFAKKTMGTSDVRLDVKLNKYVGAVASRTCRTACACASPVRGMMMRTRRRSSSPSCRLTPSRASRPSPLRRIKCRARRLLHTKN